MRSRPWLIWTFSGLAALAVACGGDDGSSGSGGGTSTGGGAGGGSCNGTLQILQKDAYKETAGRTSELWPPHTTTQLQYVCTPGVETVTTFQANHGTEPGEVDQNGDVLLVETGQLAFSGDSDQLAVLRQAYDACLCDTAFLSLDALEDQAVQDLVEALGAYITTNLACTGSVDAAGLVMLLETGQIEAAIAELPNCTWSGGTDWEGAFDEALQAIIDQASETLADYHVCNNDALLQAKLVETFVQTGEVVPCDGGDAICRGPAWYYAP